MARLSACVITFNEEKNIARCLASLSFADEIIVVDSGSTDRTVEIAKQYATKVVHNDWTGFGPQKKFAYSLATGEWILDVDADEEVSPELRQEILAVLKEPQEYSFFVFPRKNYFGDRWIKFGSCFGNYPNYQDRFFRRDKILCIDNLVHEKRKFDGKKGILKGELIHYAYDNMVDYRRSLVYYGRLKALDKLRKKKTWPFFDMLIFPLRIIASFLNSYFLKLDFAKGLFGLRLSYEQVCYVAIKHGLPIIWRLSGKSEDDVIEKIIFTGRT